MKNFVLPFCFYGVRLSDLLTAAIEGLLCLIVYKIPLTVFCVESINLTFLTPYFSFPN